MRYYFRAFKNYANGEGRATRKELWLFILFDFIVMFVVGFADGFFGLIPEALDIGYGWLSITYLLISLLPRICLHIRRLHDVDKSGYWCLAAAVPILCLYFLYLVLFKAGTPGANQYGMPSGRKTYRKPEQHTKRIDQETANVERVVDTRQILYCNRCGFKLLDGSRFCSNCGKEIK